MPKRKNCNLVQYADHAMSSVDLRVYLLVQRKIPPCLRGEVILKRLRLAGSINTQIVNFQWLLVVPLLYHQHKNEEELIFPYCAYELFSPNTMTNIQLALVVIQICSLVIVVVLWTHNNNKVVSYIF